MSGPRRCALVPLAVVAVVVALISPASAHPLGNFTVSQYHGLRLYPDRIDDTAVLDDAEIPTLQRRGTVDADGDGTASAAELAHYAITTCRQFADNLRIDIGGKAVAWAVTSGSFTYRPGAANLQTGRTECQLSAAADLRRPATIKLRDNYQPNRIGWHEITAAGHGVGIKDPPVPATSVSGELRNYPNDLLASPLNQRTVELRTAPGNTGPGGAAQPTVPAAGPLTRAMGTVGDRLNNLVGSDQLTPLAGLLGILLALLLGAAHAALPGHGKSVMAAYIAGRQGTYRDAITVGVTVTATHTSGVLAIGLLLTTVSSLAGETLLGWLGVAGGLLIASIGIGLLTSALTARRERQRAPDPLPSGDRAHEEPLLVAVGAAHHHTHRHGHGHAHPIDSPHSQHHRKAGRRGLIGLGVAGGLVPSPSALIVLLGAIALGRTWFGVLLVIAYGLGMATALTAAGLLLLHLHGRLAHRVGAVSGKLAAATPLATATLVLVVGVVLAAQALGPLLGLDT